MQLIYRVVDDYYFAKIFLMVLLSFTYKLPKKLILLTIKFIHSLLIMYTPTIDK